MRAEELSVSQSRPSVKNSLADYMRDPALEVHSFWRQLKLFMFAQCVGKQRIERIRDIMTMWCAI